MERTEDCGGRLINAWTEPAGTGAWIWAFTIDRSEAIELFGYAFCSEAQALAIALKTARGRLATPAAMATPAH